MDPEIPRAKFLLVAAQFLTRILTPSWPEQVFILTDMYQVTITDYHMMIFIPHYSPLWQNNEVEVWCWTGKGAAVEEESRWFDSRPCTRRRQAVGDTIQPTLHCTSGRPHPQSSEFLQISKCKHSIKILKNAFLRVSIVLISLKSFREYLNMTDEEEVYRFLKN